MDGDKYCTSCGNLLPEGADFCPACGANIRSGSVSNTGPNPYVGAGLGFSFLILLYGIFATIMGISGMFEGFSLTEAYYNDLIKIVSDMTGMDASAYLPVWTSDMPIKMGVSYGALCVSGILAIACYWYCRKATEWRTTVILCGAASAVCLVMLVSTMTSSMGIILFGIGVIFTLILYTRKTAFLA